MQLRARVIRKKAFLYVLHEACSRSHMGSKIQSYIQKRPLKLHLSYCPYYKNPLIQHTPNLMFLPIRIIAKNTSSSVTSYILNLSSSHPCTTYIPHIKQTYPSLPNSSTGIFVIIITSLVCSPSAHVPSISLTYPTRGMQPMARGLHVAQDGYECGPTQNRQIPSNIMRFFL